MINFIKLHWEFLAGLIVGILGVNLYGLYTREKDTLLKDIEKLIEDCKSCESFDERSEYKMPEWLELSTGELHRKSLFSLRRIRKEMQKYYKIHLDEDLEKEFGKEDESGNIPF